MAADVIGHVETATGDVLVTRGDATRENLSAGAPVYQGDILQTGTGAAVEIVFIDDTTFSLGEDARMVLDELIFDAQAEQGGAVFSVLQGAFATGKIGEDEPDNMIINTPVAMIGISCTKAAGRIGVGGEISLITVIEGAIVVRNAGGSITLDVPKQSTRIASFVTAPERPFIITTEELEKTLGTDIKIFLERFGEYVPDPPPPVPAPVAGSAPTRRSWLNRRSMLRHRKTTTAGTATP